MWKTLNLSVFAVCCVVYRIEAIRCSSNVNFKFGQAGIVPDIIDDLPVQLEFLSIVFPSKAAVNLGNTLTTTQTKIQPNLRCDLDTASIYTILLTDPDAPSRAEPTRREFRHWLKVNIPGSDLSLDKGETIFEYYSPSPPQGTGLHRYAFFLFKQLNGKTKFDLPFISGNSSQSRSNTSTKDLISKYQLEPFAGNFFQEEYGN